MKTTLHQAPTLSSTKFVFLALSLFCTWLILFQLSCFLAVYCRRSPRLGIERLKLTKKLWEHKGVNFFISKPLTFVHLSWAPSDQQPHGWVPIAAVPAECALYLCQVRSEVLLILPTLKCLISASSPDPRIWETTPSFALELLK